MTMIAVGVVLVFAYFKLKPSWDRFVLYFYSINWNLIFTIFIIGIIVLLILYSIIKKALEKRKEEIRIKEIAYEKAREPARELEKYLRKDLDRHIYSHKLKEELDKIREFIETVPKNIKIEFDNEIKKYFEKYEKEYNLLRSNEIYILEKEEKKADEENREREERERQITELFEFKKSRKSVDAIPLNCKYSSDIVRTAENRMEEYLHLEKWRKESKQAALSYYANNGLDTEPHLNYWEGPIYAQVREEIKQGKVKLKKLDYSEGKLEKSFYRAKGLREDIKNKVLMQGFKFVNGVDLDGKPVPGYYIKKDNEKESDYHFYMKHLFGEFNQNVKIEHLIDNKWVDAVYIYKGMKVGVEIETGKNKEIQLVDKVNWLNRNFDFWMFVCSRKLIPKYSQYVDNKKSFCLTSKNAKKKFRELIAAVKQR